MRDVLITKEISVLSSDYNHPLKLKAGMTQKVVFDHKENYGNPRNDPFWWSDEDRVRPKYDKSGGCKAVPMLAAELQQAL